MVAGWSDADRTRIARWHREAPNWQHEHAVESPGITLSAGHLSLVVEPVLRRDCRIGPARVLDHLSATRLERPQVRIHRAHDRLQGLPCRVVLLRDVVAAPGPGRAMAPTLLAVTLCGPHSCRRTRLPHNGSIGPVRQRVFESSVRRACAYRNSPPPGAVKAGSWISETCTSPPAPKVRLAIIWKVPSSQR
jgi:hypothetical protein